MKDALLFDFSGTLYDGASDQEAHRALARELVERYGLAVTPESLELTTNRMVVAYLRRVGRGAYVSGPEILAGIWRRLATLFRLPNTDAAIEDFVMATRLLHRRYARLVPGAVEALDGVRALGYRVALVSQIDRDLLGDLLDELGLEAKLDVICSAEDCRLARPNPAVLRLALERLGVPASRAVVVGDDVVADVNVALAEGLTAVHVVDTPGRCFCGATHHVSDMRELPDLARRLREEP